MKSIQILLKRYLYIMNEPSAILIALILAFLFNALLDVIGLGSMGLFISLLMDASLLDPVFTDPSLLPPEDKDKMGWLRSIKDFLNIQSANQLIVCIGIFSFLSFTTKTVLSYLLQIKLAKFNINKRISLQRTIFEAYMHAPLSFHLSRNYPGLLYHLNYLSGAFVNSFSASLINLVGNTILVSLIVLFLAKTNLIGTLAVSVLFGGTGAIYFFIIKDRAAAYAQEVGVATKAVGKTVKEALNSLKETRILACEDYFKNQLNKNYTIICSNDLKTSALGLMPRPLAEMMLIAFIVFFTLIYFVKFGDIAAVSSTLGIFAFAGLRIVPAASSMIGCLQGIKAYSFVVHDLHKEIIAIEEMHAEEKVLAQKTTHAPESDNAIPFQNEIDLSSLSYRYPETDEDVIKGLNLKIKRGSTSALIGRSGSGKSTLMNLLLGQLIPSSGTISVDNQNIHDNIRGWHKLISYLPQVIYVLDDSVIRNVAFGVEDEDIDLEQVKWAVKEAQLEDLVNQLPQGLETALGDQGERISGGQRQRIGIARALYHQREVLIMDEATSALDEETEAEVKESIQKLKGKLTVIMITHHLKDEEDFDNIYRMSDGQIVTKESLQ